MTLQLLIRIFHFSLLKNKLGLTIQTDKHELNFIKQIFI